MTEELNSLPKRTQLAAAFITYISAAPEDQRKDSIDQWMKAVNLESNSSFYTNSVHLQIWLYILIANI